MAAQFARPNGDSLRNDWTTETGGTTNIYQSIDEATPNNADWVQEVFGTPLEYRATLSSVSGVTSQDTYTMRTRYAKLNPSAVQVNINILLINGISGTTIATRVFTNISTAVTQDTYSLTQEEIDKIEGMPNPTLRIRFVPSISGGGVETGIKITWFELEVEAAFVAQAFAASPGTVTIDIEADRDIFVVIAIPGAQTVSSVTDSGGNTYVQLQSKAQANVERVEIWGSLNAPNAAASVTITLSASAKFAVVVGNYRRNQTRLGNTGNNGGTTADPTISLTIQDNGNLIIAGFGIEGTVLPTAKTGTFRKSIATSGGGGASNASATMADNTGALAGASVTCAVTHAAEDWAAVAIELRGMPSQFVNQSEDLG